MVWRILRSGAKATPRFRPRLAAGSLTLLAMSCGTYLRPWQHGGDETPSGDRPASRPSDTGWTPIQLSWTRTAQLFPVDRAVHGLRLSVFTADNRKVFGLDLGLGIGGSLGGGGLALALVANSSGGSFYGVQLAGLANYNSGGSRGANPAEYPTIGAQISIFGNKARFVGGWQIGGVNFCDRLYGHQLGMVSGACGFYGLQSSLLVNMAGEAFGVQIAPYNSAQHLAGVQVGLLNEAGSGLQIGLLNFNQSGFLPVFPLFNF